MPRLKIAVEGMTCEHCETSVRAALQRAGAINPEAEFSASSSARLGMCLRCS